jgi:hypothetical protein
VCQQSNRSKMSTDADYLANIKAVLTTVVGAYRDLLTDWDTTTTAQKKDVLFSYCMQMEYARQHIHAIAAREAT